MKHLMIVWVALVVGSGCGSESSKSVDPTVTIGGATGQVKQPTSSVGRTLPRGETVPQRETRPREHPQPTDERPPRQPTRPPRAPDKAPSTTANGLPELVVDGGARCRVREICRFPRRDDEIAMTTEWVVDGDGRVLIETRKPGVSFFGADSSRNEYAYGPNGALVWRRFSSDANLDGVYERSESLWYDAAGRVIRREFDRNNDGTADEVETQQWDGAGRLVRTLVDVNGDGSLIQRFETDYLDSGEAKQKRWYENDQLVGSETSFFDAAGRLIRRERDDDGDGTADHVTRFTITDLPTGELVATDWTDDGIVDRIERLTRDDQGRVVLRELDLDANGTFDSQISTLFADGKRIEETRTLSGAGLVLSITRRVYGADDRLLSSAMDWTGDGIDDATTSYSYHPSLNVLTEIAMRNGDVLRSLEWWTYRADGQLVEHVERNEAGIRTFDEQKSYFANGWSASRTRKLVDIKFEETKIDVMACTYDYTTSCEPLASAPIPKLPTLGATQP